VLILLLFFVDQTHLAREKAKADAEYYKAERQAESYKVNLLVTLFQFYYSY